MNLIASFFSGVLNFLFGCSHDNVTRPFTLQHRTYKVCLDCGHELPYSAQTMRFVSAREAFAQEVSGQEVAMPSAFPSVLPRVVPSVAPARTAAILAFQAPRAMQREHTLRDSNVAA